LSELAKKDEVDLVFAIGSTDKKTRGIFGYSEADKKLVESSK
jgi:cytochrome b pre-mRNA-processing protein 3